MACPCAFARISPHWRPRIHGLSPRIFLTEYFRQISCGAPGAEMGFRRIAGQDFLKHLIAALQPSESSNE